jgi:hypothetical protein
MKVTCPHCKKHIDIVANIESWSRVVKEKYNNKCAFCGSTENLESHHILPQAVYPQFRLDLENGICVCEKCHRLLGIIANKMIMENASDNSDCAVQLGDAVGLDYRQFGKSKETILSLANTGLNYTDIGIAAAELLGRGKPISRQYVTDVIHGKK